MHQHITRLALTNGDAVSKAAIDLIAAIKNKSNWLGDEQKHDLKSLSKIFSKIANSNKNSPDDAPRATRAAQHCIQEMRTPLRVRSLRVGTSGAAMEATAETAAPDGGNVASKPRELIVKSGLAGLPKRIVRELQALDSNDDHVDALPARSTRSHTCKASSASNMARALCTAAAIANCCVMPQAASARQYPL